jgi:DNA invertase Pin-like site-specific DNA recombinase
MARRISSKPAPDRQPLVYGYCRVSTAEQSQNGISLDEQKRRVDIVRLREAGSTLMAIKALMAERGFRLSRRTIANICARARLAGAA